jgi:hypothetical protein
MNGFVMKRLLPGIVRMSCVALTALACERALAPQRSTIGDLRRRATTGVGPFVGRVRERDPLLPCWRATRAVPGARVEIGLWDGIPAFYRDTLMHQPPTAPNDPRFQLLSSTITDGDGRFRIDSMPRGVAYAMRVIPPDGSPWTVGYGESMYGVPNDATLEAFRAERERTKGKAFGPNGDFPILCVPSR